MQRISTATKAVDLYGAGKHGFKNGNLPLGISATDLDADWCNGLQEEIVGVIEAAGIAPSGAALNQLWLAIANAVTTKGAAAAGGTADAITADFTPDIAALTNGLTLRVRSGASNATATPTFAPDALAAKTIVKGAGSALVAGDIAGAGHWLELQFDSPLDKWVLQNPATGVSVAGVPDATTVAKGKVQLATNAEAQAGIDATKAVTPAGLAAAVPNASETVVGKVELADATETRAMTDTARAVTPANFPAPFTGSNQSLAASGYQKLPGGLILQWGTIALAVDTSIAITFPITFPTALVHLNFLPSFAGLHQTSTGAINVSPGSTSGATLYNGSDIGGNSRWLALGY